MRIAYVFGLLALGLITAALTGLFGDDGLETVAAPVETTQTDIARTTTAPASTTTTTTTAPLVDRAPDMDAYGVLVEDHLGTTTTTEPVLQVASQAPVSEPPPSTSQPPAAGATTTTAPPPPPPPVAEGGANAEFESQFASLINSYRSSNGLGGLTRDGSLDSRARSWSEGMAANGSLSHSNIGSLLPPWSTAAENVAYAGSVSAAFDGLAGSSGHRENMLGSYTHFGVGVWVDTSGTVWTTHIFAG